MQRGMKAHLAAGGDNVAPATPPIFPLLPFQQHEGCPEGHHPCKPCPQPAGMGVNICEPSSWQLGAGAAQACRGATPQPHMRKRSSSFSAMTR